MNMTRLGRIAGVEEEPISSDAQDCGHDRVRLTTELSGPPGKRQICVCKFDDCLVGPLQRMVRRRATVHTKPFPTHVPTTISPPTHSATHPLPHTR
jgi:hypothetical protein